ncbi:anhydro-N-acetylmuramic acid kinase [Flavobacteriaceae bacterium UJ101]|nr:anhydro-N-acetylmuramic acid kinase [Flavobacteriaceae bacterium UJ101]
MIESRMNSMNQKEKIQDEYGKAYYTIGLMSGTSLDGLDICYAKFTLQEKWSFEIIEAETIDYDRFWKEKLKNSIHISSEDLLSLDVEFAQFLGNQTQQFIEKYQIQKLDLIASHGHTVFHQPDKGFTLQIGDGRWISKITQYPVVYDFRSQDVILGGQGAPLVPIGDELLFSEYDYCLNLGGFSNISYKEEGKRIAYDIAPVNSVLNQLALKKGLDYDIDGKLAGKGQISTDLLNKLNNLSFYSKKQPKSLGVEWVRKEINPILQNDFNSIEDQMATFVEHSAFQIGQNVQKNKKILCTGGGALNSFLMERIYFYCGNKVEIPSKSLINYKEALIFAFLGVLRKEGKINVLKTVTGANKNHSSGIVQNC